MKGFVVLLEPNTVKGERGKKGVITVLLVFMFSCFLLCFRGVVKVINWTHMMQSVMTDKCIPTGGVSNQEALRLTRRRKKKLQLKLNCLD